MLLPVETNSAVLPGIGGKVWWEDWSRVATLAAVNSKEVPLEPGHH